MLKTAITRPVADGLKLKLETVESKLAAHAANLEKANESANPPEVTATSVESTLKVSKVKKTKFFCKLHRNNLLHNTPDCQNIVKNDAGKSKERWKHKKGRSKAHTAEEDEKEDELDDDHQAHAVFTSKVAISQQSWDKIFVYMTTELDQKRGSIIINCGSTTHMTPHAEWFETESFKILNPPHHVCFGDNTTTDAIGIRNVWVSSKVKNKRYKICLRNTLLVPTFRITLVSVSQLEKAGHKSIFDKCKASITHNHDTIMATKHKKGLYHLQVQPLGKLPLAYSCYATPQRRSFTSQQIDLDGSL
jgi:hypothetical protein